MIEYDLDISGFPPDQLDRWTQDYVEDVLEAVAIAARDEWQQQARDSGLTTTRELYLNAIGEVTRPTQDSAEITLKGFLPNAIESGLNSFDMKPGLLKGRDRVVIPMQDSGGPEPPVMKTGDRLSSRPSGATKASGSVKFRTVSVNSPPGSWVHPGLKPLNLLDNVIDYLDSNVGEIADTLSRKEK